MRGQERQEELTGHIYKYNFRVCPRVMTARVMLQTHGDILHRGGEAVCPSVICAFVYTYIYVYMYICRYGLCFHTDIYIHTHICFSVVLLYFYVYIYILLLYFYVYICILYSSWLLSNICVYLCFTCVPLLLHFS